MYEWSKQLYLGGKMKQLNFYDFFQEKNKSFQAKNEKYVGGLGAIGLITPTENFEIYNNARLDINNNIVDGLGTHEDTTQELLSYIYPELPASSSPAETVQNFIHILYLINDTCDNGIAILSIPAYINQYQLFQLKQLNLILKQLGVACLSSVQRHIPFTNKESESINELLCSDEIGISRLIDFLIKEERVDYSSNLADMYQKSKQPISHSKKN